MEGSPIKRPFVLLNDNSAYVQGLANSENFKSTDVVVTFLLSTESSKNMKFSGGFYHSLERLVGIQLRRNQEPLASTASGIVLFLRLVSIAFTHDLEIL